MKTEKEQGEISLPGAGAWKHTGRSFLPDPADAYHYHGDLYNVPQSLIFKPVRKSHD